MKILSLKIDKFSANHTVGTLFRLLKTSVKNYSRIPKQMSQIYHKTSEKYSYVRCPESKLF